MRIGFFGDGPWSHEALKLIESDSSFELSFICIRNDPGDEHLKKIALENNIPLFQHKNVNSEEFIKNLKATKSDLFVSLAFNQIFKSQIIEMPELGVINCHAGKLPEYRGRNILNWALINDEKEFGITVHYIVEGIDTGDIILQKCFQINDSDTYKTLLKVAYKQCGPIVLEALQRIRDNNVTRTKQKDIPIEGFYCVGRKEGDEIIDWNQTSREIFNFIRAVTDPGPNARTKLNGRTFQIVSSELIEAYEDDEDPPGRIISVYPHLFVKTKDTYIKITEFIYDGKIKPGDFFE